MSLGRRAVTASLAAALMTVSAVSRAEPSTADEARAEKLFNEAREAFTKKDYISACAKFAASDKLDPGPGTLRSLAECEAARGRFLASRKHYKEAIARNPATPGILAAFKEELEALEKRIPHLILRLPQDAPAVMVVKVDGQVVRFADRRKDEDVSVDPGQHVVVLLARGRAPSTENVETPEGSTKRLFLVLGARSDDSAEDGMPPSEAPRGGCAGCAVAVDDGRSTTPMTGLALLLALAARRPRKPLSKRFSRRR